MAEYLDKSAAYDRSTLCDWYISGVDNSEPVWTAAHIDELLNDFLVFPKDAVSAAVVERKTGRWVLDDSEYGTCYRCSKCNHIAPENIQWYFCPVCGTDMR